MIFLMLCFGFQEIEIVELTINVRSANVLATGKKTNFGSSVVIVLNETMNGIQEKNNVFITQDDLGKIAPIGCTIKVKGEKVSVMTAEGIERTGVVVKKLDQIKVVGFAPILIPNEEKKRVSQTRKSIPIAPKLKTGVEFK